MIRCGFTVAKGTMMAGKDIAVKSYVVRLIAMHTTTRPTGSSPPTMLEINSSIYTRHSD
jgi:hypothetical protein